MTGQAWALIWLSGALLFALFIDEPNHRRPYWADHLIRLGAALIWPLWLLIVWLALPSTGPKDLP